MSRSRALRLVFAMVLAVGGPSMAAVLAAPPAPRWVTKPSVTHDGNTKSWTIAFELATPTDVEVAVVDPETGKVVRHLAAGVLGDKAPPPFAPKSLHQSVAWDGLDDSGTPVRNPLATAIRVRAGMQVELECIVGGDPYAFYSREMSDGDHSPWGILGLEAKSDGRVFVLGRSSNLGTIALREYDVDGNFRRTVFPPPAGLKHEAVEGWGIHVLPDGTYVPKYNRVTDPSPTTTFLDVGNLRAARLLPNPDPDRLEFWSPTKGSLFQRLVTKTDGSIAASPEERLPGPLVREPPLALGPIEPGSHVVHSMRGPMFTAFAPDGKSFYLSGLFAAKQRYGTILEVASDGFWRDGRVWRIDRETGKATPFFSLDAQTIPTSKGDRAAAFGGVESVSALHGVAVDENGHVFVCDRLNSRLVVLDERGAVVREIPLEHPDAVVVSDRTGAIYATTRVGDHHRRGTVRLLKFDDWKSTEPAFSVEVSKTGYTGHHTHSHLALCETDAGTNVWVAHTQMPVRVYRDGGEGAPRLLKDFYEGAQHALGLERMQVDPVTDDVYVLDAHDKVWRIDDWSDPRFEPVPLETASIGIDAGRRHVYARTLRDPGSSNARGRLARFHLDRDGYPAANVGSTGTNRITPPVQYEWCFEGNSDKGIAVAPNGDVALVGEPGDGLRVFARGEEVPWPATKIADLPRLAGGVRLDRHGNLYVGVVDSTGPHELPGFEGDPYLQAIGRIHVYAPTGDPRTGPCFPTPPKGPSRVLDVPFGAFETKCVSRTPRFGIDGFGRVYYPTNVAARVGIADNAGNRILQFGTYGNRDSAGGLDGDLVPTAGVPLAFPNSVDATNDHVYVADMVNLRVLRLRKAFATVETVDLSRATKASP